MPPLYTKQLGPYELVRRLGHGGMAETFLAVRRGPDGFTQQVCVKRLLPHRAAEPSTLRAFVREAHLVAALSHPNIVRILELGEDEGEPYIVLELIDGLDLRALLRARNAMRRPLPPTLVACLAVQLSAALHAAHTAVTSHGPRGIFHRDISPENVLLGRAGEVKLVDFGIARPVEDHSTTATGVVKGKADYMAPEYARTGDFDTRCDQYSLGVVLYECLTGSRPHHGRTEIEVLQRASEGDHARAADVVPGVPAVLDAFVERLLSPRPDGRFESPEALIEAADALAPPPRATRDLAELVLALRADEEHESGQRVVPSAAQATAQLQSKLFGGRRAARRQRLAALAVAAAALLTGAALWLRQPMQRQATDPDQALAGETDERAAPAEPAGPTPPVSPRPEASTGDLPPASAPSPAPAPAPAATQADHKAEKAEAPTPRRGQGRSERRPPTRARRNARARSASLQVVVVPFGKVWVDGELRGEAPVTLTLDSGAHRVEVGRKQPTLTRQVTLAPDERKQIVLRL